MSEITENVVQGLVIYADGGARPNPGYAGWGIHGYLYDLITPKKPAGVSDHIVTTRGYMTKEDAGLKDKKDDGVKEERRHYVEVTPIHYVDGYGSFNYLTSNNVSELNAAINALEHALKYNIKELQVFTDSEYVRRGLDEYVEGWKQNNWLKQDATPPANVVFWKRLDELKCQLVERGVEVKINWVKGHDDILGNVMADRLATVGVMASKQNKTITDITTTAAEGYWKYVVNQHPFLANRRMYFNSIDKYVRTGEYFLGEHGKDDDLLGKRISDGAYAVVYLDEPDATVELVRDHQIKMAAGRDAIVVIRLDQLYKSRTHQDLNDFGSLSLDQSDPNRLDLICLDRNPLTRELQPPKIAMWAIESINDLVRRFGYYRENDSSVVKTDITDVFYTITTKEVKKTKEVTSTLKLKPEFNVGFASLKVDANYKRDNGIVNTPITLTLGLDLLDRNGLRRLETMSPKITLITWLEAPEIFRFATVIEVNGACGIWGSCYSNLHIVPDKK